MLLVIILAMMLGSCDKEENYDSVEDYMPSKKMIKTFYDEAEEMNRVHRYDLYLGNKIQVKYKDKYTKTVIIYLLDENKLSLGAYFDIDGEFQYDYITTTGEYVNEPELIGPIKVGTMFKSEGANAEITRTDVEVTTPAGVFNTFEVTYRYPNKVYRDYYAKDIGVVRTVIEGAKKIDLINIEYLEIM